MSTLRFEWDERKAAANQHRHGVSFEEACTAFFDERARLIDDPDHSEGEERFILLGLNSTLRLLVVCHCYAAKATSFASSRHARQRRASRSLTRNRCSMRKEYDFSKSRKNPYASQLKKQITIRLDEDAIAYFKGISEEVGIPYQSLINLYLRDCAASQRKLSLSWKKSAAGGAGG